MKIRSLTAAAGLSLFCLVLSPAVFAHTKAEIDASADKALKHFYALAPANRQLADKALFGDLSFEGSKITKIKN